MLGDRHEENVTTGILYRSQQKLLYSNSIKMAAMKILFS